MQDARNKEVGLIEKINAQHSSSSLPKSEDASLSLSLSLRGVGSLVTRRCWNTVQAISRQSVGMHSKIEI